MVKRSALFDIACVLPFMYLHQKKNAKKIEFQKNMLANMWPKQYFLYALILVSVGIYWFTDILVFPATELFQSFPGVFRNFQLFWSIISTNLLDLRFVRKLNSSVELSQDKT